MSDTATIMKQGTQGNFMYWKLAIWKLFYGTAGVIMGAGYAIVENWTLMSPASRFLAVGGLIYAVFKFWDAFLDNTVARLAAGKTPVGITNGNGNGHGSRLEATATVDVKSVPNAKPPNP